MNEVECRFALKTLTEEMKVYMPEPDSYTCDWNVCLTQFETWKKKKKKKLQIHLDVADVLACEMITLPPF